MEQGWDTRFDANRAANLLLDIAHEKSLDSLLRKVVEGASARPDLACVQVWLMEEAVLARVGAPNQETPCLELVAAFGKPLDGSDKPILNFTDPKSRIPITYGMLGRVATTGEQIWVTEDLADLEKEVGFDWLSREHIHAASGTPIVYKGEVLGVLAGFTRRDIPAESRPWGRIFADHIGAAIANARAFEEIQRLKAQVELQNTYLQEEVVEAKAFGDLVGQSAALRQVISQIDLVAPTEASVLILGETGTGKELVAHEIHRRSARRDGPLVRVNCASIPRELFESEFFGHVKGAFTGAIKDRAGRFETASGGTIFLDEIGEVPIDMQNKLLRVLQEKRYEQVGDDRTRHTNVRVIAATNRDLKKAVAAGKFREDLYYRLHVFPIQVLPLRERLDDIPLLARHFVELSARDLKCPKPRLTRAAVAKLQNYDWPGNVRELRNVVERAVILARGGLLDFDLPVTRVSPESASPAPSDAAKTPEYLTEAELQQRERENLFIILEKANWKIKGPNGAAELLGVRPTTLLSRMEKWGLKKACRSASALSAFNLRSDRCDTLTANARNAGERRD